MKIDTKQFLRTAEETIEDEGLQAAYETGMLRFTTARQEAYALVPDVEELRDELKAIRAATIRNLGQHLETFERNAQAAGATVHWARDAQEVGQIVLEIAKKQRHPPGSQVQVDGHRGGAPQRCAGRRRASRWWRLTWGST